VATKKKTTNKRKPGKRKADGAQARSEVADIAELFELTAWAEAELALQRKRVDLIDDNLRQHDAAVELHAAGDDSWRPPPLPLTIDQKREVHDIFAARVRWLEARLYKLTRRVDGVLKAWRALRADYTRVKDGDRANFDAATALAKYITLVREQSKDTAFALHQAVHSAVHARLIHTLRDYNDPKARATSYPRAERRVRAALSLRNIGKQSDLHAAVLARQIIATLTALSEASPR
jgi:hypothetical protein